MSTTNKPKVKICNPDGTSIESRVRRLRRYIESRRPDFESEATFIKWADKTMRHSLENMARFGYIEITK